MSQFLANTLNRLVHEEPLTAIRFLGKLANEARAKGNNSGALRFEREAHDVQQMMAA